jgi:transposase
MDLPLRRGDDEQSQRWMSQLKWQRLIAFENLANTLVKHLDGILNYCHTKVRFGVVEAV